MQSNATCLPKVAKSAWPSFPHPNYIWVLLCLWLTDLRCCEATCAHGIIHKVLRGQQAREHFIWRCQLLACVLLRDAEVYAPDPRTFWYLTWMCLWPCWFVNVCLHTCKTLDLITCMYIFPAVPASADHISGEITLGNLHAVFAGIDDETGGNLSKSRYKKDKRDWASKDFHLQPSIVVFFYFFYRAMWYGVDIHVIYCMNVGTHNQGRLRSPSPLVICTKILAKIIDQNYIDTRSSAAASCL